MAEKFKQIPVPLQKQILIRLAGSGPGLAMLVLILAYRGSWQLMLPGIAIFLAFTMSAWLLFRKCADGSYVVIRGECIEIERTGIRKKIKAVYIQSEDRCIRIVTQLQKIRKLSVGDKLTVYLAENAPVYDHDNCLVIFNVIAAGKEW